MIKKNANNKDKNNAQTKNRIDELESEGWERRNITSEPRLSEIIELYESLDLEIHLEQMSNELFESIAGECNVCFSYNWEKYKIIFTRKKKV